jgi:hypothetical protein
MTLPIFRVVFPRVMRDCHRGRREVNLAEGADVGVRVLTAQIGHVDTEGVELVGSAPEI